MTAGRKKPAFSGILFWAGAAVLCALLIFLSTGISAQAALTPPDEAYIVVSLGDSYASGEGVEPFYDQNLPISEKVKSADWIAHRSHNSWAGQLKIPALYGDCPLSALKDMYWFFEAVSGAKTPEVTGIGVHWEDTALRKKYTYFEADSSLLGPELSIVSGTKDLSPQIKIFDQIEYGTVRYVTLSIGGNDAQFVSVLKKVLLGSSYLDFNNVEEFIADFYKNDAEKLRLIIDSIVFTIKEVSRAAGPQATILVAGYPRLLSEEEKVVKSFFIESAEAKAVNKAVSDFNDHIEEAVEKLRTKEGVDVWFVDVEEGGFKGHEAYTSDPYINPLMLNFGGYREDIDQGNPISQYSFHPNNDSKDGKGGGLEVYRKCFQEKIDWIEENLKKPKTPSDTPSDSIVASGECGDSLHWILDREGCVTVYGTGSMWDYDVYDKRSPWSWNETITEVIIKEGVTGIGDHAFFGCHGLKKAAFPTSLSRIGSEAFGGCFALAGEITIPRNVDFLGDNVFLDCGSLEKIHVDPGNMAYYSIDGVLFNRHAEILLEYPKGRPESSYTVPDGVETIAYRAFYYSKLKEITIPKSVSKIERDAFQWCDELSDVYFAGSESEWNQISIDRSNSCLTDASLHFLSADDDWFTEFGSADLYYILSVEDTEGGWNCELEAHNYYSFSEESVRQMKPGQTIDLGHVGLFTVKTVESWYVYLGDDSYNKYEIRQDGSGRWILYQVYWGPMTWYIGSRTVFVPNTAVLINNTVIPNEYVDSPHKLGPYYDNGSETVYLEDGIAVEITFYDKTVTEMRSLYSP